jgi:hypothetical protein
MAGLERISDSEATLRLLDFSVRLGFEVRTAIDPNDMTNFKSGTLVG